MDSNLSLEDIKLLWKNNMKEYTRDGFVYGQG